MLGKNIEHEYSLFELLRRPEVGYRLLMTLQINGEATGEVLTDPLAIEQVEICRLYTSRCV